MPYLYYNRSEYRPIHDEDNYTFTPRKGISFFPHRERDLSALYPLSPRLQSNRVFKDVPNLTSSYNESFVFTF